MRFHFGRRTNVRAIRLIGVILGLLLVWLVLERVAVRRAVQPPFAENAQPPAGGRVVEKQQPAPRQTLAPQPDRLKDPVDQRGAHQRLRMVEEQLRGRDITDQRVLDAMRRVPRHRFVAETHRDLAYTDQPLPIGHGQTISQPYIVALMTQLARTQPNARALDVGTGSGYQAAVLAELVETVYSIEIVCPLADQARDRLKSLGYRNIEVRCGDGYRGSPEHAPFDLIIVAAAPQHIPQPLIEQLAPGGRMVIPVGRWYQNLIVVEKQRDGSIRKSVVAPVAFVPMTGEARNRKDRP